MSDSIYRIALGADHGGVQLKNFIVAYLKQKGHEVVDYGTDSSDSVDYADYANEVAQELADGMYDAGILVCTSGVGVCMAANRFIGVRGANVRTAEEAKIAREHNDANLLCLGQKHVAGSEMEGIVEAFLHTEFEGGRHTRRLLKASGSALAKGDAEVFAAVTAEGRRQRSHIELIASENFTSPAVMEAQGSLLTNKYAEGYPGKRWYGGCEHVDVVEQIALDRLKKIQIYQL